MEKNKKPLMKHFAAVLRKRALSTVELNEAINSQILKFFTRKDLIQIITDKHDGTIPKEHNLVELENKELLTIIGDDMYIISYITKKWCEETQMKKALLKSVAHSNSQNETGNKDLIGKMDTVISKAVAKESQKGNSKAKPSTAGKTKK